MPVTSAAAPEAAAETINQPATGGPSDALEFELSQSNKLCKNR